MASAPSQAISTMRQAVWECGQRSVVVIIQGRLSPMILLKIALDQQKRDSKNVPLYFDVGKTPFLEKLTVERCRMVPEPNPMKRMPTSPFRKGQVDWRKFL